MAEVPALQLSGVVKDYGEGVVARVLYGIDLEVQRGEFSAIIGPSGSGKSTLLNLVGLLDRPSGGSILIGGQETTALDDEALALLRSTSLGFIFQFHHLLSGFTALENVAMPMMAREGRMTPAMKERAAELLGEVGLADRLHSRTNQLSGGQQQRVAVARALVMQPLIVLADEPTGNLDTKSSDQVFDLLRRFNVERRTTVLVVTHDSRLANRCDRTVEVVDGRIIRDDRGRGDGG